MSGCIGIYTTSKQTDKKTAKLERAAHAPASQTLTA